MKKIFLLIVGLFYMYLSLSTNLTTWESVSLCLFVYFFLEFLYDLGNRIVILDLAIILATFTCLVMPIVFYHQYTKANYLAHLWVKYMPIEGNLYFSFATPAVIALILGYRFPLGRLNVNKDPSFYVNNIKKYLARKPNLGLILIGIGVGSGIAEVLTPAALKQVLYFFEHLTYVGVFYVIYSPNKHKKWIVAGVIVLMFAQTIVTGMFGEFIYILACSLVLLLLGTKISFARKVLFNVAGIILILVIQSVKGDYRTRSWKENGGQADPMYFAQLVGDRLTNPAETLDPDHFFFIAVRMNQGWLIAVTMARVPKKFPFADGETIWKSVAAAIVPRLLWPDKPEVGGKYNMQRFWGYNIVGYSMNIGTLGEAYGNFDRAGGVVFMFFYGLFFNYVLWVLLKMAEKRPTLMLWIPFLFFYAITVETDLLTTMGALIKGVIFTVIIFKLFSLAFKIDF